MFNFLGGPFKDAITGEGQVWDQVGLSWLQPVISALDNLIIPITIVVAIAGAIWVIILGVKLARAETADKAKEAKGALIRVAVAIVASLVLIWLLVWLASELPTIIGEDGKGGHNPFITNSGGGGGSSSRA